MSRVTTSRRISAAVFARFATKDQGEREDDEAERLIRKAPKVKPPRHDLRRDRMDTDRDPDLNERDQDLSTNYKNIGGSVLTAKSKLITVRLTDDPSKVVQVTPDTLKSEPSKYKEIEKEDSEVEKKPTEDKPTGKAEKKQKTSPNPKDLARAQSSLSAMAKADEEFAAILQDFKNPKSDMFQWARSRPETPIGQFLRGRVPPKGIETLGDLQGALLYKAPKVKTQEPAQEEPVPTEAPVEAPAPAAPSAPEAPEAVEPAAPEPETPSAPAQEAPEPSEEGTTPTETVPPKAKGKSKKKSEPVPEATPKLTPAPPTRSVTKGEQDAASLQIIRTFPTAVAVELSLIRPKLHPDEVTRLIGDYHLAKAAPSKASDLDDLRKLASSFYTTDPNKVKPPKTVAKNGHEVPFSELSSEEQNTAWRQHQIQTVAMSLAARSSIKDTLKDKAGAPKELAESLAGFLLSGKDEAPQARDKRASKVAEGLFYKSLKSQEDQAPVSLGTINKVLSSVKDPATKRVAVGYFQARDYNEARHHFLNPESENHISERQSPDVIATRLATAMDFLRDRADRYPEGMASDIAATFRAQVMRRLGALDPEKQLLIQELLDEEDNSYYDKSLAKYDKSLKAYQKAQKKAEDEFNAEYKAYSEKLKEGAEKDPDPPLSSLDRLASEGVLQPVEPLRPAHYDLHRKGPQELADTASNMWEAFKSRVATDKKVSVKVVERFASSPFFTYPVTSAMERNRQAVYWGVEPEKVQSYPGWEQPQARDLNDKDLTRLLTAARGWLKTPVLSSDIEGIVRDTQLRAALDLAIQTENYSQALHPTTYNQLLARLAGKPQDETLMTIMATDEKSSKTARKKMPKISMDSQAADQILARLDRIASTVQKSHEQWGMKFEAAKGLLNEIDRVADELESAAYGSESLAIRQAQIITGSEKTAEVIQRDSDEKYMDTFKNPQKPIQTEADEPYMRSYAVDQSSEVNHGKASNGRPLAP